MTDDDFKHEPSGWRILFAHQIKEMSKEIPKDELLTSSGSLRFEFCLEIAKLIPPIKTEEENVKCGLCGREISKQSAWVSNNGGWSYICSCCALTMRRVDR